MKSVIKYVIEEITETKGYDSLTGNMVVQKEAKMRTLFTSDPNDPNFVYGHLSSGSSQVLKTINPEVYNTWYVGAEVTCEITVSAKQEN